MKKQIFFRWLALALCVTMLIAFAGCHKDDDPSPSDPLTGQWQSERKPYYVYTLNGDGTGKYKMAGTDYDIIYSAENGKITISIQAEGYTPLTFDYFLEGDRLNIRDSYGKDTFYVRVKE